MPYQRARGTKDEFPEDLVLVEWLERKARDLFRQFGVREIRTPLFEETRLFERGLGEGSDVVSKEMFTVSREDSSYTFRPEGTAGVVRAYLEKGLHKVRPFQKFFYIGPMFRFERPQAGRMRQFSQIGLETLGSLDPLLDAEAIHLAASFFDEIGLSGVEVRVNSMGDREDMDQYRAMLRAWIEPQLGAGLRCDDCLVRFQRNVLRVLDCKVQRCRQLNETAPSITQALTQDSRAHLFAVMTALNGLGRQAIHDTSIVRGFDYYTRTVFELHHPDLGSRSAVCGGGRYDHLIEELGGPDLGAVGFAIGMTPTIVALERLERSGPATPRELEAFVIILDDVPRHYGLQLVANLRSMNIACDIDHPAEAFAPARSLKAQLRAADRALAYGAFILGPIELSQKCATFKPLRVKGSSEELVKLEDLQRMVELVDSQREVTRRDDIHSGG